MAQTPRISAPWPIIGHDVLGHHIVGLIDRKELPSVVLFVGPKAVGKSTAALWLAHYALCNSASARPCGTCSDCRRIAGDEHPSVTRIQGENGRIGIEQLRDVMHTYHTASWAKQQRWLLLTDIDHMTESAGNAILKFLEELPPQLHVIMTSSEPDRLLATMRSRATTYYWHLVPSDTFPESERAQRDRAAGRPGWFHQFADDTARQTDREDATTVFRQFVSPAAGHRASPTDREATEATLRFEETVVRDMMLASAGTRRRTLWPDITQQQVLPRDRVLAVAEAYLQRHTLSKNIQPRLLYEDLHLV